jgi:hypothetical protein
LVELHQYMNYISSYLDGKHEPELGQNDL